MGSLFFDKESREKQTRNAITPCAIQSFLEFYSSYLLDNRIVDNKESCFEQIGRIVSDSMDRGECSVATMEHMKQFVQSYSVKTERMQKKDQFQSLFARICYELAKKPSAELSPEMVDKLVKYKQVCDDKRRMEQEFAVELKAPISQVLSSYVGGHKSAIKADLEFMS